MVCSVYKIHVLEFSSAAALVQFLIRHVAAKKCEIYELSGAFRLIFKTKNAESERLPTIKNAYTEYFKTMEYGNKIFSLNS